MGRLKGPRQTIVFLKYKVAIKKKEKERQREKYPSWSNQHQNFSRKQTKVKHIIQFNV
jgi:hypothetical protein